MGDLISRSALINNISKLCGNVGFVLPEQVWDIITAQPTAYSVDAVENELEQFKTTVYSELLEEEVEVINLDRAKAIVRKGGKE